MEGFIFAKLSVYFEIIAVMLSTFVLGFG